MLGQLHAVATELHDDPPGAVVLWGGRRIFAAGADIVELDGTGADAVGANFAAALGALATRAAGHHCRRQRRTPSAAGWSWRWPATSVSAPRTPASVCPRSCWA